jgi:hypothetical protein
VKDRRRDSRWQINRQAKVKLEGAQAFAPCRIKDINFKGLQLSLGMKLPKETFLKLSIAFADEFTLSLEAWVVWHRCIDRFNLYGLYFSKIDEQDKEKIYRFVHKHLPHEMIKGPWQETEMQETETKIGGETMQDRRIFARFPVNYSLRFIDLHTNKEGEARADNFSAKGLGVVTNKELKSQTPLEMWLKVPDRGEPLYARGEVVWSERLEPNKYRVGVELEKADLMGMSRIFRR